MRYKPEFMLFIVGITTAKDRLKRQSVPSQHLQVNSLESSVVLGGQTFVQSDENRIDFNERFLNGSVWSDSSRLNFNSQDTFSKVSAKNSELFFNVEGNAKVHSQGVIGDVFLKTNRTTDQHSVMNHFVQGSANLSFDDGVLKVQGVNGKRIEMDLLTWNRDFEKKITLEAETITGGGRRLIIDAVDKPYHATIRFEEALIYFAYAGKYIKLDPTYKFIEIYTEKYTVSVRTKNAPFELSFENKEVVIKLPAEQTKVRVHLEGVNVNSKQLTKSGGKITVLGEKPITANGVLITAKKTSLDMNNEGKVDSNTENSFVLVESNLQPVGLTAARHNLKVNDGVPHILVDPGISQVEIIAVRGGFELGNLLGPFKPRPDKFADVGPFSKGVPPPGFFPAPMIPRPPVTPIAPEPSTEVPAPVPGAAPVEGGAGEKIPNPPGAELPNPPGEGLPAQTTPEVPRPPGNEVPNPPGDGVPNPPGVEGPGSPGEGAPQVPQDQPSVGGEPLAADLPQRRPETADETRRVVNEKNVTDTKTSMDHTTKKPPVTIDPLLAKLMAADLPQPRRPSTPSSPESTTTLPSGNTPEMTTSEATQTTTTTLLTTAVVETESTTLLETTSSTMQTTSSVKLPVTIDPLLAKMMAADLPQPKRPETPAGPENVPTTNASEKPTFEVSEATSLPVTVEETTTSAERPSTIPPQLDGQFAADLPQPARLPSEETISDNIVTEPQRASSEGTTEVTVTSAQETPVEKEQEETTHGSSPEGSSTSEGVSSEEPTTRLPGAKGFVDSKTIIEDETNITETTLSQKGKEKQQPKVDPLLANAMTADLPQRRPPATESTTEEPPTTTKLTTASTEPSTTETSTTSTTTTTTTSMTTEQTTTTTLSPLEELKKLRAEMQKMKKFREWEEEEVSHGGDGDEHVEEFTFPNGTTVHRVVKTSRKITTTITHHRKEEINDTSAEAEQKPAMLRNVIVSASEDTTDSRRKRQTVPMVPLPQFEFVKRDYLENGVYEKQWSRTQLFPLFRKGLIVHKPLKKELKVNNKDLF